MMKSSTALLIAAAILVFSAGAVFTRPARAQSVKDRPAFLTSWKAQSYTPSWYAGKILPARGSSIRVRFDVIAKNGRKLDLSESRIRWYINNKLIVNETRGLGIKSINFDVRDFAGRITEVRVDVLDLEKYGLDQFSPLTHIFYIPVSRPYVGIESPLSETLVAAGSQVVFKAHPFFYNASSLEGIGVRWSSEGGAISAEGNPWDGTLFVDSRTPPGFSISIGATSRRADNNLDAASNNLTLTVQ